MKPLSADRATERDIALARKLRDRHVKNALRIVLECSHRHDGLLPVSLGLALQEQESGGRNIFGADTSAPFAHLPVTQARVMALVKHVRNGGKSNGVGPLQLTFIGFIDEANRDGGAWTPAVNIATGLGIVAGHIKQHGVRGGLATYNAGHPASPEGQAYADEVLRKQAHFHGFMTPAAAHA
jgi:hypothetical protein